MTTVRTQTGRAKRKQLLSITDEGIQVRIKELTGKPPWTLAALRKRARKPIKRTGVYFLFHNDKLVYVGRSYNLDRRILTHTLTGKFNKSVGLEVPRKYVAELEALYIYYFNPPLNRTAPRHMKGVKDVTRQKNTKRTKAIKRAVQNKKD